MDSQLPPAHRHTYEEDPHRTGLHAVIEREDESHEKKSVLQKVKAKAKKLKDSLGIKKHGHGLDHSHDHPEVGEDDEEEEEEVVQAPNLYVYESTVTQIVLTQSGADLGPTTQSPPLEKDTEAAKKLFEPSHPGYYQTRVTDPTGTGGTEARVDPLVSSFGKMGISNDEPVEPTTTPQKTGENLQATLPQSFNAPISESYSQVQEQPKQSTYTGKLLSPTKGNDQFSSTVIPPNTTTQPTGENFQPGIPESFNAGKEDSYSQANEVQEQPNQSSYTDRISAATCMVADKAVSAKTVVASKLGYGGNDDVAEGGDASKSGTVSDYGRQVAATVTEKLTPVYEKVAEAGSAVMSKLQGTETTTEEMGVGETDKGVTVKEFVAEKLKPSDEDKALSEVITETLHMNKGEEPEKVLERQDQITVSPEVITRLNEDKAPEGIKSSSEDGKTMVDSIKGTVTSWFGTNEEEQPPQQQTLQAAPQTSVTGNVTVGWIEIGQDDTGGYRKVNESTTTPKPTDS